jgi:predicted metal-dependent HD superfamily phosphohydrolase
MFTVMAAIQSDLRARYMDLHRFHHGEAHIDALLAQWHMRQTSLRDPQAVELAIWFHDAIYQPGAQDNEQRSEALLRRMLADHVAPSRLERAARMILATENHLVPSGLPTAETDDIAAFLDMDISILGAGAAAYDLYAIAVRQKFLPVVGADAWRDGRAGFLRATLASAAPLFHAPEMRAALEARARSNMERELTDSAAARQHGTSGSAPLREPGLRAAHFSGNRYDQRMMRAFFVLRLPRAWQGAGPWRKRS